jgi:YD repeat-containing protein
MSHEVGGSAALSAPIELSRACLDEIEEASDQLPRHLECTGLYQDADTLEIADSLELFAPAYPLWTDAAQKNRWIFVPEGEKIDASDPNAWKFPQGTRLWKEFQSPDGTRKIETRMFMKSEEGDWSYTTYVWDDAGRRATRHDQGKELTVDGKPYALPSHTECNDCHAGRRERVLGFDAVSLGLTSEGHDGMTLDKLVSEKRLKNFDGDSATQYQIGPDPESAESRALGWMHNNCGVSCHNTNPNSKAYSSGLRLNLDPTQLDGRPTSEFIAIKTTVDQDVFALQWQGQKRIEPGKPEASLLYKLIISRGDPKQQMPPLGTNYTDDESIEIVKAWITGMKAPEAASGDSDQVD